MKRTFCYVSLLALLLSLFALPCYSGLKLASEEKYGAYLFTYFTGNR